MKALLIIALAAVCSIAVAEKTIRITVKMPDETWELAKAHEGSKKQLKAAATSELIQWLTSIAQQEQSAALPTVVAPTATTLNTTTTTAGVTTTADE